jgi:hypothetical protein
MQEAQRVKNSASAELTTVPQMRLICHPLPLSCGPAPRPSGHRLLSLYCRFAFLLNQYVKQCKELIPVYHRKAGGVNQKIFGGDLIHRLYFL